MHSDYFEGILQLRNPTEVVIDYVESSGEDISQVKKAKNGLDYYFVSQRSLRALGKTLQKSFAGELKTSRTIFTRNRQTGKDVYRVTVLFRCYNIKKGDLVVIRGRQFRVLSVGSKVFVQNLEDMTKRWIPYSGL
ncbi:MAG: NMD3-related protein [Candidatus Woesearchaeota archaeon]